jgi:hypothetical protein
MPGFSAKSRNTHAIQLGRRRSISSTDIPTTYAETRLRLRTSGLAGCRVGIASREIEGFSLRSIDRGSRAAWTTQWILETFWATDVEGFSRAFEEAREYQDDVLWNLVIVTAGLISSIAIARNVAYEDVLPVIWRQLAGQGDTEESSLMRAMVSAWSFGDTGGVEAFEEPEGLAGADPVALIMNFAAITRVLLHELRELTNESIGAVSVTVWEMLGTT